MRVRHVVVAGMLLALVTAGCGSSAGTKAKAQIPSYRITTAEAAGDAFSFTVPTGMKGGVIHLVLDNATGKNEHDFQLVEATTGHTLKEVVDDVANEAAPLPAWLQAAGGSGGAGAGKTSEATVELAPGTYWYFCTQSSGEGDKQISHAKNGMAGELTLAGRSGAALPSTDNGEIDAREYTFTTTNVKAGQGELKFHNSGTQLHFALLTQMLAGKTIDDVKKALADENSSAPPPVDFEKAVGSAVVNPGQTEFFTANLEAGKSYALVCFMPDKGTAGPPHAAKGMIVEVKVS